MSLNWVIKKSGGIHRFDWARELLIPKGVWEEWEASIGKPISPKGSMSEKKFDNKLMSIGGMYNTHMKNLSKDNLKDSFRILLDKEPHEVNAILKMLSKEQIEKLIAGVDDHIAAVGNNPLAIFVDNDKAKNLKAKLNDYI